ncbi:MULTISPECIES: cyclase family protein [unclassified Arthrobacter]|uniref:cyclase family protein n=1 Tax=unclassified Arthrobacter TaxID=235627 RepID=UPI0004889629|nr:MULTISPECIES: cyclase family protein [unclassified Arthrobacter]GIU54348.1 cyclase [Arthrobacter sp. NicSoilC12]
MTSQDTAPTTTGTGESATDSPVIRRDDPLGSIRAMAESHNNWGRWGQDDVLGTLNFIDADKRIEAAALVKTGEAFSLSQPFDTNGPQKGWRRRTNPVHTMTDTGVDAERGNQGFPHGFGGADDVIAMPLQCSTQWDGLGHIFDQGKAWNGRAAGDVVTSEGDLVTGIETAAAKIVTRGVLLDVGRALGPELGRNDGELPDGFAITPEHLQRTIDLQGPSSKVGRGDILVIRTGQHTRVRRDGWGDYAGGSAPGLSFSTAPWLHRSEIAGIATDTWGFEVRPNEFDGAFQPLHQIAIPNLGLFLGEMWDPDGLAEACAADGRYDFLLTAAPLPITGAVGSPVNPIALR